MRVLVAGAGVSGQGVAQMLAPLGDDVVIVDERPEYLHPDEVNPADFDVLVTSPGWRPDNPFLVAAAKQVEVIDDIELAWRLDQQGLFGRAHTWLGVTGTNGKTTTTGMLNTIMQTAGYKSLAVGNIGTPIGEAMWSDATVLCVELSSFQLHWSNSVEPAAGCLLNLADDHLDWHGSFEAYADAKAKLLHAQTPIINADDPAVAAAVARNNFHDTVGFTMGEPQPGQIGVVDGQVIDRAFGLGEVLFNVSDVNVPGTAGLMDAIAAAAIARSQGVPAQTIALGLSRFEVAKHRGQIVHRVPVQGSSAQSGSAQGDSAAPMTVFIDNSKATNPHAALAALSGLDNILWIGGGQLKGADVEELVLTHGPHMRAAFLLGQDREILVEALGRHFPHLPVHITDSQDPEEAMRDLLVAMRPYVEDGPCTVALAPAAASLDMFTGMSERGDIFATLARELYPC
ncbi:MAG: UDP-N-acetylmuramoyl-L-alanine--D-glutamate ligase [Corynebacterium sp.]|nr:UDP-N-acetylmuramoyl-L-alanine--D-glutamate ligase [Corynebacterium sp.]